MSLIPKFITPKYRALRGFLFLILGISTAVPFFHYLLFLYYILLIISDEKVGMIDDSELYLWAVGGITYISGCLIYILRFPERFYPGKFDYLVIIIINFLGK